MHYYFLALDKRVTGPRVPSLCWETCSCLESLGIGMWGIHSEEGECFDWQYSDRPIRHPQVSVDW